MALLLPWNTGAGGVLLPLDITEALLPWDITDTLSPGILQILSPGILQGGTSALGYYGEATAALDITDRCCCPRTLCGAKLPWNHMGRPLPQWDEGGHCGPGMLQEGHCDLGTLGGGHCGPAAVMWEAQLPLGRPDNLRL